MDEATKLEAREWAAQFKQAVAKRPKAVQQAVRKLLGKKAQ